MKMFSRDGSLQRWRSDAGAGGARKVDHCVYGLTV